MPLRHYYRLDVAVRVELHAVYADDAMVLAFARNRTAVVADVPLVRSWDANDGMMPRTSRNRSLDAQHLPLEIERPERRIAHRVVHAIVVPRPVAA